VVRHRDNTYWIDTACSSRSFTHMRLVLIMSGCNPSTALSSGASGRSSVKLRTSHESDMLYVLRLSRMQVPTQDNSYTVSICDVSTEKVKARIASITCSVSAALRDFEATKSISPKKLTSPTRENYMPHSSNQYRAAGRYYGNNRTAHPTPTDLGDSSTTIIYNIMFR
jgi:hypothetical protein